MKVSSADEVAAWEHKGKWESRGLSNEDQIAKVLNSLYEIVACRRCGTRIRFGDVECPHCGIDVDDELRVWAARLLDKLDARESS